MLSLAGWILLVILQAGLFGRGEPPKQTARDSDDAELKPQVIGGDTVTPRGGRDRPKTPNRLSNADSPFSELRPKLPEGENGPDSRTPQPQRGDPMADEAMRSDARLADVCFIGPRHGWAVGDRGTILHTEDGGRRWHLQQSDVSCPLRSVWFLNEQVGWAAGGFAHPYTHTGSGVVLWTRDGGRHWHRDPKLLLPALAQVRFFNERHGWAVGCASAMFPAGVFVTQDGGRTWMPPCGAATSGWLAADFLDTKTGAIAGRMGAAATLQYGQLRPSQPGLGLRGLARVKLVPPSFGWLIGDGGLVMMTADLGRTWAPPPGDLERTGSPCFDFSALAVRGPKCWIAGSPGSRVFHSPDAGRTWTAFSTGTNVPIRALSFADDEHGCAVGDLGTILTTEDSGRTWHRQRAGGIRAAMLAFFAQPEDIPWELLAKHCAGEGYLGVVNVVGRRDPEVRPREEVHAADRTHEAVVAVGGCGAETAWRFPLQQIESRSSAILTLEDGNQDGRSADDLQEHLVRQIRLWRPEVLLTHDAMQREDNLPAAGVCQAVQDAARKAADPTCFPAHITSAGLKPWQVKAVYAVLPLQTHVGSELPTAQLAPRLGRSLEDVAAQPRALLDDRFRPSPAAIGLRRLTGRVSSSAAVPAAYLEPSETRVPEANRSGLFSASDLAPGSEARRAPGAAQSENTDLLQRLALRRRHSQAILERFEQDPQAAERLLAQTEELTRGLDPASAAQVLYRLADRYHRTGRWDLAAETFLSLVERYPEDLLCRPALRWLVQYYAAGETQGSTTASQKSDRLGRAVALGQEIERTRPDVFADPAVRFPVAAAYRRLGRAREADRLYLMDRRGAEHDAWWACAQGEAWMTLPKGQSPKPVLTCVKTSTRPKLDGRLDDAVWQRAKPAVLASPRRDDSQWPSTVMLAHDDQFLYLGISCRQAPGAKYAPATGTRSRDSDLSGHDRVEVLLDTDRDYATYYRLVIDHRGWAAESCFGDETWNPKWFIATQAGDGVWTAEAAIPLSELGGQVAAALRSERDSEVVAVAGVEGEGRASPPMGADRRPSMAPALAPSASSPSVWAIGIQRTVPGVGFQSWSTPASPRTIPEGFGYMVVE